MRTAKALPPCLFQLPFPSSAKRERKRGANYVGHLGMTLHKIGSIVKDDKTEENTFEILQHSDININNS